MTAAAVVLLISAFVSGATFDEEEYRFAVLSAWLHVRALVTGVDPTWTPLLGLGMPQPFVPTFAFHPLAPLLAVMTPVAWVRLLLAAHTVAGAVGMWLLASSLGVGAFVRAASVVTFLFSAPVHNYVLSDFWPSHYVVWTAMPWLLLGLWRMLASSSPESGRLAVILGLVCGIVTVSANPAYLLVFGVIPVAIVTTRPAASACRAAGLAVAAGLAIIIAAPTLLQLVRERQYFGHDLALSNVTTPLPLETLWRGVMHPLAGSVGSREVFFGGPFMILAIVGTVLFARRHPDLLVGFLLSGVCLFTSVVPAPWISQRYQFRDPLTLCGILLAALVADRLIRHSRLQAAGAVVVIAQIGLTAAATWPLVERAWQLQAGGALVFAGAVGQTTLADALIQSMPERGRVLMSPAVGQAMAERALVEDGLGINALAYRGIPVVNGIFKGVSADVVSPDSRLFYGDVRTPAALMAAGGALDVLGIKYVIASDRETQPSGVRELARVPTLRGEGLVLYGNDDPWQEAFLIDGRFGDTPLQILAGCGHDRLLCRDLSELRAHADVGGVQVRREGNAIAVRWRPTTEPRILVISQMFRPEWRARVGERPLPTRAMYGGLLGIPLPPGADEVRVEYTNVAQRAAMIASYAAVFGSLLFIARRRSRRASATADTARSP